MIYVRLWWQSLEKGEPKKKYNWTGKSTPNSSIKKNVNNILWKTHNKSQFKTNWQIHECTQTNKAIKHTFSKLVFSFHMEKHMASMQWRKREREREKLNEIDKEFHAVLHSAYLSQKLFDLFSYQFTYRRSNGKQSNRKIEKKNIAFIFYEIFLCMYEFGISFATCCSYYM